MYKSKPTSSYVALFFFVLVAAWSVLYFTHFPEKPVDQTDYNTHYSSWVIDTSDKTWKTMPSCETLTQAQEMLGTLDSGGWCNMFTDTDQDQIYVEKISAYLNTTD